MSTFRVLVTGSRTWRDKAAVWNALDGIVASHPGWHITVVHGACPYGADKFASEWVKDLEYATGIIEEKYPANWRKGGRAAGIRRNELMVRLGANLCLTFIDPCRDEHCPRQEVHGSHGSVHCATAAARAGIPVQHCAPAVSGPSVRRAMRIDPTLDLQLEMGA